jgi:hypothetical protein
MDLRVFDMLWSLGTFAVMLGGVILVLKLIIGKSSSGN